MFGEWITRCSSSTRSWVQFPRSAFFIPLFIDTMSVLSHSSTDQCLAGPEPRAAARGDSVGIVIIFFLVSVLVFCAAFVLAVALARERSKRCSSPRVATRDVGSQSPTTYTRKNSQPRFKPLPDYAHG